AEIVASLPAADSAIDLAAIAPAELTPTVLAQIPPTRRPEPRVVALPLTNGGTLVSRHVHGAQRTTIGIYFSRGSSDDLHPGGIDLTLALLQYGGDELDRDALLARITELGGTLSHYVDRRESGVELSIPTHRAAEAVVLLEVLLTQQGKFAPEDIVTASRTQASERRAAFDDIRRRAGQDLWEAGIGGDFARHPKGNLSLEGPEASVPPPAPSQGELQVLWDALLQETAAIVVSGDVDRTGAEDALDPLRGLIPVPGKPIILWDDREAGDLTVGDHHDVVDRTQAAVYVAGRADGIGSSSRDYAATQVLSRGLGLRNFRELIYGPEALAYSSSASLLDTGDAGAIALFAYVDPARVPEARNMLAAQVEEMLVHGMEEPELSNVKGWWLGSLAVSAEDQATMARRIGSYAALDLGWDYQPKFEAAIQAVTEADVRRIADRVFGNREWLWVVVGPATAPEEVG
ncbi:MAG TPA: insulinase family protein, partial [bacterium]|nr:insulinase family protein [bacterium]